MVRMVSNDSRLRDRGYHGCGNSCGENHFCACFPKNYAFFALFIHIFYGFFFHVIDLVVFSRYKVSCLCFFVCFL